MLLFSLHAGQCVKKVAIYFEYRILEKCFILCTFMILFNQLSTLLSWSLVLLSVFSSSSLLLFAFSSLSYSSFPFWPFDLNFLCGKTSSNVSFHGFPSEMFNRISNTVKKTKNHCKGAQN